MKISTCGKTIAGVAAVLVAATSLGGCAHKPAGVLSQESSSAAEKVYVAPGKYDEFYAFLSGGYNGQVGVYGLPSGRMFKMIPVFSEDPDSGYGYSEETKPLLMTSYGFMPWDDAHHPEFSMTNGTPDGKWLFINGNNTPRIARINLRTFETQETIEIPNAAGNHSSPFTSTNSEYVVAGTRFSVPVPNRDVPIDSYKEAAKGVISFVKVDPASGNMSLAFQILVPAFDYDIAHFGKGPSADWVYFTSYNTEKAHDLLEVNASQNDKDFTLAINWKKAEEYARQGKGVTMSTPYYDNRLDDKSRVAKSTVFSKELVLDPRQCTGIAYFLPTPKSPHGVDVDPTGHYVVAGGKLATAVPVFSTDKIQGAVANNAVEKTIDGIPVLKYQSILAAEVKDPGLGPLHDEFDGNGYAYTTNFISSEISKWKLGTWQVVDRIPTYYSPGHLLIPGGDTTKPWGKYLVALNKITKDRYLPTGPEMCHSAQLIDISGDKMKLLLDFPTVGEPHYGQAIPANLLAPKSQKIFDLASNAHPYAVKSEDQTRVERKGHDVHVYMSMIRSHLSPDNIEGLKVGDTVYFHVTDLEQDWGIAHGFAVMGADFPNIRVMGGETRTVVWKPQKPGIYPFYCTDFCSALHQEMQGYARVSAASASTPITWSTAGDVYPAKKGG